MFQVKTLRLQHSNQGAHLETRSKFCLYFFTELYTWKADFIELRNEKVKANVADFLKAFLCVNLDCQTQFDSPNGLSNTVLVWSLWFGVPLLSNLSSPSCFQNIF